jgi:hypothetical protein
VLSAFAERVGEKELNRAIASFARLHAFGAAPYPTGEDFIAHLETAFPSQKAWIGAQFRRISLVDFRIRDQRKTQLSDGKWKVEATVAVEAREADAKGAETVRPFADKIRIWGTGAPDRRGYCGPQQGEARVFVKSGDNRISFVCEREPKELLVDPLVHWIGNRPSDRKARL